MDSNCQNSDLSAKYLLGQLHTARREINNLRQQVRSLRYVHQKDVENIKRLLEMQKDGASPSELISSEEVKPSTSTDDDALKLKPIGIISTWFPNKRGTPRQPGICEKAPGKVILYNSVFTNPEHALQGLQDFSHMWILFHFHRNDSTHIRAKVAPPRLNGVRTGVFSTRSPHRPCPIGLSLVKIIRIENCTIYFEGVDMVDKSPVLDIKPYIPQYDSPLHIEKLSNRSREMNVNDVNMSEHMEEGANLNGGQTLNSFDSNFDCDDRISSLLQDTYCTVTQDTDVSRDEEIALRLQAEEFQQNPDFENYENSRHFSANIESSIMEEDQTATVLHGTSQFIQNISPSSVLSDIESRPENIRGINSRLQGINLDGQDNIDTSYSMSINVDNYMETHNSRSSRLLDGADGPNTVCGTDLDLIHRRALNSRIDNSPIRMGVREAPDGEEGLESQTLTPSQTLSNIQMARTISNNDLRDSTDINFSSGNESRFSQNTRTDSNSSEVRIPDWISRPRTTTLSVVFNDRALIQLNEILEDKADEQKDAIESVLREDPRSVYLRQRLGNQFYTFLIHNLHITCKFDDNRGVVTVFQIRHAGRTCECGEPEWQCLGHSP